MPASKFLFNHRKGFFFILIWLLVLGAFIRKIDHTILFRRFVTHRTFTGDEPKYFRMVHSLWKDGDVNLADLWLEEQEREKLGGTYRGKTIRRFGDFYFVGINGGIFPIHMPGLAVWTLLPFSLDAAFFPSVPDQGPSNLEFLPERLVFTRLWLLLTAAAVLGFILRLCLWFVRSAVISAALLLAFVAYSPFPEYAVKFYPASAAAFFTLLALNGILHPYIRNRRLNDFFIAAGIGFLPWFHQRFLPLSLGLFLVFVWRRRAEAGGLKNVLPVCLILSVFALPYFYYFYTITGSPSPLSVSESYGKVFARFSTIPLGFFGHLFSEREGIIWWYPWTIFSLAGMYWSWKTKKQETLMLSAVILPYYLMASAGVPWSGGTLPPGRFLVPLLPLFLLFAGQAAGNLVRKYSWFKMYFYVFLLVMVMVYRRVRYIDFDFSYSMMTSADLLRAAWGAAFLLGLFGLLYAGDKLVFSKVGKNLWDVFSPAEKMPFPKNSDE